MAIIYSYPLKTTPLGEDLLVLTDSAVKSKNATRSLTIDSLASYIVGNYPGSPINGSGTLRTVPLWTPDGKTLGDSNINQDANGDIAVGVNLIVVDDLSVQGEIDVDNTITVNGSGNSMFNGPVIFNDNSAFYGDTVFEGEVDFQTSVTANGVAGTAGQVLSSTGNNVQWVDASEGTVSGPGTSPYLPYWLDSETLGDSIITQGALGQGVTVTGELDVTEDFKVSGSTVLNDSLTANGVSQFNAEVKDKTGQPGSSGQVLSSTGTNVQWIDTVSGSGTSPFLPYWLDDKTLDDSPISWLPINTPQPKLTIDTNVSITGETTCLDDITVTQALLAPDSTTPNSETPGTPGQVLTSTGTNVEWVDPTDVVSGSVATLIPYETTATPGGSETYTALNNIVEIGWLGATGIYVIDLPSAATIPYRVIRFVTNGTYPGGGSHKVRFTAVGTETIDGAAFFEISKVYEGLSIWSTGAEWIVIQAKAH